MKTFEARQGLAMHANQIQIGRLEMTRKVKEVKFDFKVVAKSKALKLQRGSHPSKPSRPRQDDPQCMKTSSF